jgi:hypothetical protein
MGQSIPLSEGVGDMSFAFDLYHERARGRSEVAEWGRERKGWGFHRLLNIDT